MIHYLFLDYQIHTFPAWSCSIWMARNRYNPRAWQPGHATVFKGCCLLFHLSITCSTPMRGRVTTSSGKGGTRLEKRCVNTAACPSVGVSQGAPGHRGTVLYLQDDHRYRRLPWPERMECPSGTPCPLQPCTQGRGHQSRGIAVGLGPDGCTHGEPHGRGNPSHPESLAARPFISK